MTTDKPPTDEHEDDGFARHSRRALAAGAVLVLVAVGAVWALTTGGSDKPTATAAAYDSACGLTGGSTATPTTGPEVQWQNLDGNWLPVSTTAGPGKRENGGTWSCFAHTPTGAVLAAQTIPGVMNAAEDFAAVVRAQTVPGAGQLAALKVGQPKFTGGQTATPLGFVLNSYAADAATVTFYVRASSATRAPTTLRYTTTVQWLGSPDGGDWQLRLTADGNSVASGEQVTEPLSSVPGFVSWGPSA